MNKLSQLLILLLILLCQGCFQAKEHSIKNGVLNLENWNFGKQGTVSLEGEWKFYWKELLGPREIQEKKVKEIFFVPKNWLIEKKTSFEFATFTLDIELSNANQEYGLLLPYIHSAYKLWINENLLVEVGHVSSDRKLMSPTWKPKKIKFTPLSKNIEIILQVANFNSDFGGIKNAPQIGLYSQIEDIYTKLVAWEVFLVTVMATSGFLLILLSKNKKYLLWFGLFCIFLTIYTLTCRQLILISFINFDFEMMLTIKHVSMYLLPIVFTFFVNDLFPTHYSKKITQIIIVFCLANSVLVLATSSFIFMRFAFVHYIMTGIMLFHGLWVFIQAKKQEGNYFWFHFGGCFIFLITATNDILKHLGFLNTHQLMEFGMLFYTVLEIVILLLQYFSTIEEQNKKLLQLNQLKDEFLANTTHELRTPLNGIIGLTEVFINRRKHTLSSSDQNDLNTIISCSRRLLNLVGDILDYSKLRYKNVQIDQKPVDIKTSINIVLTLFKPILEKKGIQLINSISGEIPFVLADENRIQQIIFNLIDNAIKFTHEGTIRISIETKEGFLDIGISDTGIGIPKDKQEKIFIPFEQADGSITREYGGTGLGLSISKQLVELHGGKISYQALDNGSRFSFTLPIAKDTPKPFKKTQSNIQLKESEKFFHPGSYDSNQQSPNNFHILAVDDDPTNLLVLQRQLELEGYRVTISINGQEALEHIESKEKFNLVLLDIMMPRMSGYEVCQKIRENYSSEVLPIIFVTAKDQLLDLVEGLQLGGNDYLQKPFFNEELVARVQAHMRVQEGVERWISLREITTKFGSMKQHDYENLVINECQRLQIASNIEVLNSKPTCRQESRYSFNIELLNDKQVQLTRTKNEGEFSRYDLLYLERLEQDLTLLIKNEYLTVLKGMLLPEIINSKVIYVQSDRYECTIIYSDKKSKKTEISLKVLEKCHENLIRIRQQQLINRDGIESFYYEKTPKKRKKQNFYVLFKADDNSEISLNIGETYIDSLFEKLAPSQKSNFQQVILKIFPDYFSQKPVEVIHTSVN